MCGNRTSFLVSFHQSNWTGFLAYLNLLPFSPILVHGVGGGAQANGCTKHSIHHQDSKDKHIHKPQKVSNIQQSWCFNTTHCVNCNVIKVHIIFTRLILLNRLCLNLPIKIFIDKNVVRAFSEWSSNVFCWRFNQRMFGQQIATSVTQDPDTYLCAFNLFLLVFLPRLLHREGRQRMWPRTIFFSTPLLSTGLLSRSFIEHSSAALHQPQVNIVVIYHADGGRVESVTLER